MHGFKPPGSWHFLPRSLRKPSWDLLSFVMSLRVWPGQSWLWTLRSVPRLLGAELWGSEPPPALPTGFKPLVAKGRVGVRDSLPRPLPPATPTWSGSNSPRGPTTDPGPEVPGAPCLSSVPPDPSVVAVPSRSPHPPLWILNSFTIPATVNISDTCPCPPGGAHSAAPGLSTVCRCQTHQERRSSRRHGVD